MPTLPRSKDILGLDTPFEILILIQLHDNEAVYKIKPSWLFVPFTLVGFIQLVQSLALIHWKWTSLSYHSFPPFLIGTAPTITQDGYNLSIWWPQPPYQKDPVVVAASNNFSFWLMWQCHMQKTLKSFRVIRPPQPTWLGESLMWQKCLDGINAWAFLDFGRKK